MNRTRGPAAWATREWHAGRPRARHVDDSTHRPRLDVAARLAAEAVDVTGADVLVDLGAGDGGFLELVARHPVRRDLVMYGFDFTPANVAGAWERGVAVFDADIVDVAAAGVRESTPAELTRGPGERYVVTLLETLEHVEHPAVLLAALAADPAVVGLVVSVPHGETVTGFSPGHLWTWSPNELRHTLTDTGWPYGAVIRLDHPTRTTIAQAFKEPTP